MATVTAIMMTTTAAAAAAAAGRRAGGVVWGRRQAAKAAEMGINRKWEQCGYNSQNFLHRIIVTWVTFICTLQRSLVTSQILALSEVKAILFLGRLPN
jgi:hypothetical protein